MAKKSMIAREAKKQFSRQGLDIRLGCKVTQVERSKDETTIPACPIITFNEAGQLLSVSYTHLTLPTNREV